MVEPLTRRQAAVFLDRDGVVNEERHYVHKVEDFAFVEGAVAALQWLQVQGWRLVVVTNQGGISHGIYTETQYQALSLHMQAELRRAGVELDLVLHCPHHPDGVVERYKIECRCRKPAPGMLLHACDELGLDPAASVMLGDRHTDILAARAAGVGTAIAVRSGAALNGLALALADEVHDSLASWVASLHKG